MFDPGNCTPLEKEYCLDCNTEVADEGENQYPAYCPMCWAKRQAAKVVPTAPDVPAIMALVERTLSARFTPAPTEGGAGFIFLSPYWDTQIVVGWRGVGPMGLGDLLAAMRATLEAAGLCCADVTYEQARGIMILLDRGAATSLRTTSPRAVTEARRNRAAELSRRARRDYDAPGHVPAIIRYAGACYKAADKDYWQARRAR